MKPEARPQSGPAAGAAFALVLIVAGGLIFGHLGNRYLWEDEAETALLARNVLRFGVPLAYDGQQLISQWCGVELDENYLSRWHAWLPVYLTAASFKLLGPDTLPARLPFAVLAWLSVLSLPALAWRVFRHRGTAVLAAALLTLSVPFLMYARQTRYYTVGIFATIWILYFFFGLLEGRRGAVGGLVLALTVMLHANTPMFAGTGWALAIAALAAQRPGLATVRLAVAGTATLLANAPWIVLYGTPWTGAFDPDWSRSLASVPNNLVFYLRKIDRHVLPLMVPAAIGVAFLVARRRAAVDLRATGPRPTVVLLVFVLAYLAFVAVYPLPYFRYVVNLLPVLALLMAEIVRWLWRAHPAIATVAVLVMVGTDALHGWLSASGERLNAPGVRSPLVDYVREIGKDVDGPIEGIVRYLRTAARPGERLFISYGDLPLRFYTDLEIRGGGGCQGFEGWPLPDWIVVRYFEQEMYRFRSESPVPAGFAADARRTQEYLRHTIPWSAYRAIELRVVDTIWENNPEPGVHVFGSPAEGHRVVLYRRIEP